MVICSVLAISKCTKMDSKLTGLDRVRHLAQLGMWGDEDAIKKLELNNFGMTQLPEISEMESSTLRRCLNVAGKGYVAGKKLASIVWNSLLKT